MLVHCPYCPQAFDPGPDSDPSRITCPSCGRAFDLSARQTRSLEQGESRSAAPDDEDPPQLLAPDRELGGYRIVELLGRGGMGVVYKAVQLSLDRTVALKVLPPSLARHSRFLERFDREARALAELSHPNIVSIFDRGVEDGLSFIAMELVDGVSLREVLAAGGLTPHEALAIVPKICAALEYAHARGVIHRDIKPENILLDRQGGVKVADFGLSRILGDTESRGRITGTNVVMGTYDYMAPEQRESSRDVDHRADLYALGVVLYEMLTGELPLGLFEAPSQLRAGLDPRLDDVVFTVLDKDPDRRYQRASELSAQISAILDGGAPSTPTVPPRPGERRAPTTAPAAAMVTSKPMRLSGWLVALIIVGLVVILAPCCVVGALAFFASGGGG